MTCCRPRDDGGYATPAALVLSVALAMAATAMTAHSLQVLKLSRADLERSRQVHALDGAHFAAAAAVVRSGVPGPYRWAMSTDIGWMAVVAEPEADKLTFEAGAALPDATLQSLGVAAPADLKARLTEVVAEGGGDVDIAGLDPAPLWRACGPSLVSPLGRADQLVYAERQAPGPGPDPASWRIGEAWRIRIATSAGWRDDRIVRFTGDARRPAAVVVRRLSRDSDRGGECETILSNLSGA